MFISAADHCVLHDDAVFADVNGLAFGNHARSEGGTWSRLELNES